MERTVTIPKNHFTDGVRYAELIKGDCIYKVRYYTGTSQVEVKVFPSKSSAKDFIKYFIGG